MIYFAHPITEYGTALERRCLETLAPLGAVLNPNAPEHEEGYRREGMVYFKRLTGQADKCAYLRFPDGRVGAGVGQEVSWFLGKAAPVYELQEGGRVLQRVYNIGDVMSVEETRALVAALRVKDRSREAVETEGFDLKDESLAAKQDAL